MTQASFDRCEIERSAAHVTITLHCADEHSAALIYNHMADDVAAGKLQLNVNFSPVALTGDKT